MEKNITLTTRVSVCWVMRSLLAGLALFGSIGFAEVVTEDTTVTIEGNTAQPMQVPSGETMIYEIADDVTLTFTRTGTYMGQSAGTVMVGASGTLIIRPENTTGQVIFENSSVTVHGGAIQLAGVNTYLNITNGIFRNNRGGNTPNSGVGGAIMNSVATAYIKLTDVIFDGNHSYGNTGAMRVTGTLMMMGGGFYNNWAAGDHTGALHMNGSTPLVQLTNVIFDGNHTRNEGGAMLSSSGTAILTNVIFTNNWAGFQGGAIRANHAATGKLVFAFTESGGTSSYLHSGNFAAGQNKGYLTDGDMQVVNDAPAFAPHARGGGFYHSATVGVSEFNIDGGVTLTIGTADAVNRNYDTIASSTNYANIAKTGGGDMVVNANNSYFSGTTRVEEGRLLLGNDEAQYGGIISISRGASFGGSGTVTSYFYDDSVAPTSVTAVNGAILQVGVSDRATEGLTLNGTLALVNSTVSFVAFGGTHAAKLDVSGTLSVAGSNIINMQSFISGTYNMGGIAADLYNTYGASLAVNGGLVVAGGRHGASASVIGTNLQVVLEVDKARAMKWTGAAGSQWNSGDANWESLLDASITKFAAGDLVEFDTGLTGNTTVSLDSDMPIVGIEVIGSNTITFSGSGALQANPYTEGEAEAAVQAGVGKLVKKGLGTIVFENGNNEFRGGVDIIDGGEIVFSRPGQIKTGPSGIRFMQSATLQALGDGQLASPLVIGDLHTAEIITPAAITLQLDGVVSGGTLKKTGEGTLVLAAENTHAATMLNSGTLRLLHNKALGNGELSILSNDTALDVNGGLALDAAVNIAENSLRLTIVDGGGKTTTFPGNFYGNGMLSVHGRGTVVFAGNNELSSFTMGASLTVTAASSNALGGANSSVSMQPDSVLNLGYAEVLAKNLEVDGGTLKVISFGLGTPLLDLSGTLTLKNNAIIELGAKVPSGGYVLAKASSFEGVSGVDYTVDPSVNTRYTYDVEFDGSRGNVNITVIKPDVNPTKDIVSAFNSMSVVMSTVNSRINENFLSPISESHKSGVKRDYWVKGLGTFSNYEGDENNVGFRDKTYGIVTGYDREFGERLLGGLYGGYVRTDINTDRDISDTDADTLFLGAYGSTAMGRFYLSADLMLGTVGATTTRTEGETLAKGEYRATVFGASAEVGYALVSWDNGKIRPSVSLHYMDYRFRDHYERGEGAMFLDDFATSMLHGLVSVKTSNGFIAPWGKAGMFDVLVGWRCNLKDYTSTLEGAFAADLTNKFRMSTSNYSDSALVLGISTRVAVTKHSTFALAFDYENSKRHDCNTVSANLCWSW